MRRFLGLLGLGVLLVLAVAPSASADTIYTYTGSPFTSFTGSYACPPVCRVTGSFTLPQALPANFAFATIIPSSFNFTDGMTNFNGTTIRVSSFEIATDSQGLISTWSIDFVIGFIPNQILFTRNNQGTIWDESNRSTSTPGSVPNDWAYTTVSGTWSASTSSPVPEPPSLLLLGAGLLGLGTVVLLRK